MHGERSQPALDGVRGVAILLVLGQHAPTRPLADGFVGVTVFFCLSGYLITSLLLRELQTGTIDVRAFYRRRAARLYPALVTVAAATIVVLLVGRHDLSVGQVLAPAGAAAIYTTSLFDWAGHPFATQDYFNYTWTLSVEEQFYVLWPFALLWGYRRSPRLFAGLTVALIGITLALDLFLGLTRAIHFDPHEYFGTDTNALPILAGSLLAIVVRNGWLSEAVCRLAPFAVLAVALLPVLAYRNDTYHASLVIVAGTGLTLVLLTGVVTRPGSAVALLLASAPMRWLGERSYSIYLWNVLARIATLNLLGHSVAGDIVWVAMFVVLAEASFRFVERPLRARFARRSPAFGRPLLTPPPGLVKTILNPAQAGAGRAGHFGPRFKTVMRVQPDIGELPSWPLPNMAPLCSLAPNYPAWRKTDVADQVPRCRLRRRRLPLVPCPCRLWLELGWHV
ncbi:acyltransferase family protein [Terrabacter sp. BE26]|uniref:acyltransferase family protein n=1 Tax=Terrabacter sp. BE26 TaxID=2898152 RepID=UPI0035BE1D0F